MNFEEKRKELVESLKDRGILTQQNVIDAMLKVPRELFIPEDVKSSAYVDSPLSIGSGQTISAPHMNAMMCEILELKEGEKVLEVGTGSGYHAALCAEIIAPPDSKSPGHIYTIERHEDLAENARENFKKTGYDEVITVIVGDGTLGYDKEAPYDKILVTAASPSDIPSPLKDQLKEGGIMCIPAGSKRFTQYLYKIQNIDGETKKKKITGVRFVPLMGKHGFE
ncbi:MAG: Protein-L-isoaspartate O-methyltransferase [Promethearchaeota archaeon]|jgi:protein-L-isoaspartate(D-aspartate) O-methyltransferase|nr:MAG: Protein-L-isoaspartate O-methyltransferase [Candidatus Lokiarchaeota archaeon]